MDKPDWETPPAGAEIWADENGFHYFDETLEAWVDFDPPECWFEESDVNDTPISPL